MDQSKVASVFQRPSAKAATAGPTTSRKSSHSDRSGCSACSSRTCFTCSAILRTALSSRNNRPDSWKIFGGTVESTIYMAMQRKPKRRHARPHSPTRRGCR
eukprot:3231029-Pyramimonas_sp.AAC.1